MDNPQESIKFTKSDRDVLIILNTKFDLMAVDLRDIKDGLADRLAKTEARLDALDLYHAKIPVDQLLDDAKWLEGLRANWHLMIAIITGLITLLAGFLGTLLQKWFHL